MATQTEAKNKATKKEQTVEEKLRAIYNLQLVDSLLDQIEKVMRGELPIQVANLEDAVTGLRTRLEKSEEKMLELQQQLKDKKAHAAEAKKNIKHYEEQQKTVKNEREYNSLCSEIEYQELDVQLTEKQMKVIVAEMEQLKVKIETLTAQVAQQEIILHDKKKELDAIFSETQAEEEQLKILSTALSKEVDGRLLQAYQRIRKSSRNGLVVVPIHRQASLGSYILIPPQRQIEVANRNKIIVDEHSGRILIDMELAEEQKQYVSELLKKANISSEIHL